jgi:SAM-dependent methyltransferase
MDERDRFARGAAALPGEDRLRRELPFWRELAAGLGWRLVADAGCGAGFHVKLLRSLEISVAGFDLSIASLLAGERHGVAVADVTAPPLAARADAAICLGNTISLLPTRAAQRRALAALAGVLRPGGVLLLQGEDTAAIVAAGPVVRTRALADGRVHVRAFDRHGARVGMLAGVVEPGREAPLERATFLPTTAVSLTRLARPLGLRSAPLPVAPPGAGATWWLLLGPSPTRP